MGCPRVSNELTDIIEINVACKLTDVNNMIVLRVDLSLTTGNIIISTCIFDFLACQQNNGAC